MARLSERIKTAIENRRNQKTEAAPIAKDPAKRSFKLLFAILEYGKEEMLTEVFNQLGLGFYMVCHATGSDDSQLLELFGLADNRRMVLLSIVEAEKVQTVFDAAAEVYEGTCALFTAKLNSVGGMNTLKLLIGENDGSQV